MGPEPSYRPDGMPDTWRTSPADALKFGSETWMALEPLPGSAFDGIDRHILRIVLEGIFRGRTGTEPAADPTAFNTFLDPVIDYQGYMIDAKADWLRFMNRNVVPLDLSIFRFSRQSPEIRLQSEFAMISRALLLLRVASGSSAQLLYAAGFSVPALSFWWTPLGEDRGLWNGAPNPDQLYDIWADVAGSLEDVETFQATVAVADQSFSELETNWPEC